MYSLEADKWNYVDIGYTHINSKVISLWIGWIERINFTLKRDKLGGNSCANKVRDGVLIWLR